jgi:hypothetical protein
MIQTWWEEKMMDSRNEAGGNITSLRSFDDIVVCCCSGKSHSRSLGFKELASGNQRHLHLDELQIEASYQSSTPRRHHYTPLHSLKCDFPFLYSLSIVHTTEDAVKDASHCLNGAARYVSHLHCHRQPRPVLIYTR